MRSPSRFGFAPAQSGTVSRCVENSSRGPGRVPGSVDDQIAGLRRQRDPLVDVVEANGRRRHADLLQLVGDRRGDRLLFAGDAFDRQEPHQVVFGGFDVERNGWLLIGARSSQVNGMERDRFAETTAPTASPSSCQAANRIVQSTNMMTTYGSISETTVPTPAFLSYFWAKPTTSAK